MITGAQIRAARALLNWSSADLAKKAGTARQTIVRIEQFDGLPNSKVQTIVDILKVFEAAGIEFIGTPDDSPGVRINVKQSAG